MMNQGVPGSGQPMRIPTMQGAPLMASPQTAQPNMALTEMLQQFHPAKQNALQNRMAIAQNRQSLMAQPDPYQQKVDAYWAAQGGRPAAPDTSKGMAAQSFGNAQAVQSPLMMAFQRMMQGGGMQGNPLMGMRY